MNDNLGTDSEKDLALKHQFLEKFKKMPGNWPKALHQLPEFTGKPFTFTTNYGTSEAEVIIGTITRISYFPEKDHLCLYYFIPGGLARFFTPSTLNENRWRQGIEKADGSVELANYDGVLTI